MTHSTDANHYQTLGVSLSATPDQIKQAYRQLAKQHHPDTQQNGAGHEAIAQINAAYEVLSDPQRRQTYDQTHAAARHARTAEAQQRYRQRQHNPSVDQLEIWLRQVYAPVDRRLSKAINGLKGEVKLLSADPFDDELMAAFLTYLEACRSALTASQTAFKSQPNPPEVASVAANLYYCMNQFEDGIEEIERFTYTYDDSYLHTGQELFRIATQLRKEARAGVKALG